MGKFKVGEVVRCIENYEVVEKGMTGVIKFIDGNPTFGVHWNGLTKGHSLRDSLSDRSGYFVDEDKLALAIDPNELCEGYNGK